MPMKAVFIQIEAAALLLGWLHAMYRHWRLAKELQANGLPSSRLIGGFGLLRDIRRARAAILEMGASEQTRKLEVAVKWADIAPFLLFSVLVIPVIIFGITSKFK